MRRLILRLSCFALVTMILFAPAGCKRKKRRGANDDPGPFSVVHAADLKAAPQFVRGFHSVEADAWRWSEKSFTITLKPPKTGATSGAVLTLQFVLPEVSLQKLGAITLTAKVGGTALEPEKLAVAGDNEFRREIPAEVLKGDLVRVDFSLDKAIPPNEQDQRELGIIVKMAGFESRQ